MIRIGCRAHDYGKHTPVQLAHILHTAGYTGAQLAMPRAIEGIEDFASVTNAQLSAIFQAFDAEDIEITVLSCYMDLSAPDEPARLAGLENVKRCLRYAKQVGARMVGSETSWTALSDEEKALRRPLMLDSLPHCRRSCAAGRSFWRGAGGDPPLVQPGNFGRAIAGRGCPE